MHTNHTDNGHSAADSVGGEAAPAAAPAHKLTRRQVARARARRLAVEADALRTGELPRSSAAPPEIVKTVVKLDQRSMVWARDEMASDVESMGPFIAVLGLLMLIFLMPLWVSGITDGREGIGFQIGGGLVGLCLLVLIVAGIVYSLKISLFSRYADIHFNRRTRKLYTSEGKRMMCLDWDRVRPFAYPAMGPLTMGGPPFWSLELVEFGAENPKAWTQRFRVQGILPDRDGCQRIWESIRRYMDDEPERMPPVEVVPNARGWQGALLEFGPLNDVDLFVDWSLSVTERLRKHHWWPIITPVRMFYWIAFWPGPLSTILYERFRPRARLPAAWTAEETPLPGEVNPYVASALDPAERAGRRKAAWIVGVVCGTCIAIGMAGWAAAMWLAGLPMIVDTWHDVFGTPAWSAL